MADKRTEVSVVQLKGPTGSVTTNPRTLVDRVNLYGPVDKRTLVDRVTLIAPPLVSKTLVSRVQLCGPSSGTAPIYYGSPSGWVPLSVYLPSGGVWVKIA